MGPPPILVLCLVGLAASQCSWNDLESTAKHTQKSTGTEKKPCMQSGVEGAKEGCNFVVKCESGTVYNPGYYFEDDPEGDGLDVTCKSKKWVLKGTTTPVPTCIRGCTVLSSKVMENATYVSGPPAKVFYNGDEVLWPANTVIETKCKPGFYFSVSLTHQAAGRDSHKCVPGQGSGWVDQNPDPLHISMAWPAYCRGYCDPFDATKLPAGVGIVNDPSTYFNDTDNGKPVIRIGAQYVSTCKDGYKPLNAAYKDGKQTLMCEGKWRDITTGQQPADVLQCISDGCPPINSNNLPANAAVEEGTGCAGDSKPNGCKVTVKYAKSAGSGSSIGYYMPNKPSGYSLTCSKSSWIDETGAVATPTNGKFPGSCVAGCRGLTATETIYTEIVFNAPQPGNNNDEVTIYPIGSQISTSCKDSYIRPGLLVQGAVTFTCQDIGWKISIDDLIGKGIYPGTCVPACEVTTIVGTKNTIGGEVYTKNGTQWVQKGATMTRVCEEGYSPATGQQSPQSLVCEGGSAGWKNPTSNRTNESPLQCLIDGAPGCTEVPVGSGVNYTTTGDCTKINGLYPKGCVISIRCKDGYFPDGTFGLSVTGWQNLSCKAGKEGYVDVSTGTVNTAMLRCILACEYPSSYDGATYVQEADASAFFPGTYDGKRYIKPGSQVVTTCKTLSQGWYWNNEPDKNRVEAEGQVNFHYTCKGGNDKYQKLVTTMRYGIMPGDMCGPTCEGLQGSQTTGIYDTGRPDSITFTTNYTLYVVNVLYKVVCLPGYQFPPGSPEAARGYQDLLCVGGTRVYQDVGTSTYNAKPTYCQQAPEPRCPAIDQSIQKTAYTVVSGDCTPQSGSIAVDCVLNLTCQQSFFPTTTYTGSTATSTLRCKKLDNGTAVWVDSLTQVITTPMKCTPGCAVQELGGRAQIVQDSATVTVGGVSYYPPDSVVAVTCIPGYIPAVDSMYTFTYTRLNFKCTAMDATKPWLNIDFNTNERGPFVVCVKPCNALVSLPEGVRKFRGPREFVLPGSGTFTPVVAGGGTYVFNCAAGYRYDPAQPNGEQQLVCDGNTGTFWEMGAPNKTTAAIQPCQKEVGLGCKDITPQNGYIVSNCQGGFPAGCTVTVKCNDNFAPTDPKYNGTGQQVLTCRDGYDWYDSAGVKVNKSMECQTMCVFGVDSHSTIKQTVTLTVVVGGITYIPAGSEVVVQCQGDGVIWIENAQETNQEHRYKCIGGGSNYTLVGGSGSSAMLPGEGCVSTCDPFVNPNDPTLLITAPTTVTYNGKVLVPNGLKYTARCVSGFKPAAGKSATQEIKCVGNSRSYVDAATNTPVTLATSCVRDPGNDECPELQYNETVVQQLPSSCVSPYPHFFAAGCQRSYRCKQGYRPTTPDYNTLYGWKNVTCKRMGAGWEEDGTNKKVGPIALECVPGCFNDTNSTTMPQGKQTKYISGGVIATCWAPETYNASAYVQANYYSCPVPPTYFNNWCNNACRMLQQPYPTGVIAVSSALQLSNGGLSIDYVFATTTYKFVCAPGYSLPGNSNWRFTQYQTLTCNADSTYTDDTISKKNTTEIMQCVQNTGCTDLSKSSTLVSDPTRVGTCDRPTPTTYPENCGLRYGCVQNSYPSDFSYLYAGYQEVKCGSSTQKWTTTNGATPGQEVSTTLSCVSGCVSINSTTMQNIFTSLNIQLSMNNFPSTNQPTEQLQCISIDSRTNVTTILTKLAQTSGPYFCSDSKDAFGNLVFDKKNNCPNTCSALSISTSGLLVTKPAVFKPYGVDEYVKVGASYVFTCPAGQEFQVPAGSSAPTSISYACQQDGTFRNPANNMLYSNPPICVPVQQCTRPTVSSPVVISYDPTKCLASPPYAEKGCILTGYCDQGSYPTEVNNLKQASFPYECITGSLAPEWRNASNPSPTFNLQCTPGCKNLTEYAASQSSTETFELKLNTITCSAFKSNFQASIPDNTKKYFCEFQNTPGGTGKVSTFICTGACPVNFARGVTYTTLSLNGGLLTSYAPSMFPSFIGALDMPGSTVTFTCPSGQKFTDTGATSRTLVCGTDNLFKENGKVVGDLGLCV